MVDLRILTVTRVISHLSVHPKQLGCIDFSPCQSCSTFGHIGLNPCRYGVEMGVSLIGVLFLGWWYSIGDWVHQAWLGWCSGWNSNIALPNKSIKHDHLPKRAFSRSMLDFQWVYEPALFCFLFNHMLDKSHFFLHKWDHGPQWHHTGLKRVCVY